MTEKPSPQEASFQELLITAAEFQIATLNIIIEFWRAWLEQASRFSEVVSLGLEKIKMNPSDTSMVILEITEASRENLRTLTDLPKRVTANLTHEFSKIKCQTKRSVRA